MNKANFETLIKKDISDETFYLYKALWDKYKEILGENARKKDFIKILNVKNIPQDNNLKELRAYAKKEIPRLQHKIQDLENRLKEISETITWLDKQGSGLTINYRYEKIKLAKELKTTKISLLRLQKNIK